MREKEKKKEDKRLLDDYHLPGKEKKKAR